MKILCLLISLVISSSVFADCTVGFSVPKNDYDQFGILTKKSYPRIIRILEKKGFKVVTSKEEMRTANFELQIWDRWGYDCGTGLTWKDYLLIPYHYEVTLSVAKGNEIFKREKSFDLPPIVGGGRLIPRRSLMNAVRAIPTCESL